MRSFSFEFKILYSGQLDYLSVSDHTQGSDQAFFIRRRRRGPGSCPGCAPRHLLHSCSALPSVWSPPALVQGFSEPHRSPCGSGSQFNGDRHLVFFNEITKGEKYKMAACGRKAQRHDLTSALYTDVACCDLDATPSETQGRNERLKVTSWWVVELGLAPPSLCPLGGCCQASYCPHQ